ncbi:phosphoglycerate dehydrogenase [Candidatus Aerophobetes bacterium]|nr:phosphoglycerate dehydrogenase [Candidatus Aerophobetes bacterium]
MAKVLITATSFGKACREPFEVLKRGKIEVDINKEGKPFTGGRLLKIIENYDGIIVGVDPVGEAVIDKGKRLKIIAKHGVGIDNIDLKAAARKGIYVTITPGANEQAVADLTFALMLALARKVVLADCSLRNGKWPRLIGTEIWGKKLGVIGLGRVGKNVVKRAKGFNMEVFAYDLQVDHDFCRQYEVKIVNLEKIFTENDIITLHTPLTSSTRHLINEKTLSLMKDSALIINTARGELVDEQALFYALKNRKIGGAALDCFSEEPPGKDFPLFELDNVVLTPHLGAYTVEANRNMGVMAARSVVDALNGKVPENIANEDFPPF